MKTDVLLLKKKKRMLADIKTAVVDDDPRLIPLKTMAKLLSLSVKAEISSMPGIYDIKYVFLF